MLLCDEQMQAVWISLSAFSSGLRLRKDVCGGNEESSEDALYIFTIFVL